VESEKQIREKIVRLREQIEDLEEKLPQEVETRGDPVVNFK